jgi:AcrR family transcriptional regulator
MRLFLERGYGRVTVNDIARAAGTAVPTVYASTGGKSAILGTLIDRAIQDPIVDTTLCSVRGSRVARDVIQVTAGGCRADNQRYHDLIHVTITAAAVDETAAAVLARSNEVYLETLAVTTDRLRELAALRPGLTRQRATDMLWFYFGHRAWHLCVSERRWSWDEAERWLADQAAAALLDPRPVDRSGPGR